MPGPPPKRSSERRRRNETAGGPTVSVDLEALPGADDPTSLPFLIKQPIVIPEPVTGYDEADVDEDGPDRGAWHPLALEFWESLKRSGQAIYWEPSDWMVAKLMCESISRDLKPQVVGVAPASEFGPAEVIRERIPLKGASLGAYLKAFGQLMLTEGERRRLSIELERARAVPEEGEAATVTKITDRRQAKLIAAQRKAASE